jgi:cysteine desulfurase
MEREGFEVTRLDVGASGYVEPDALKRALRSDTLLVSVMHVNNETGVVQPMKEIAASLAGHAAYFHTDAAQGFGKDLEGLRNSRIDMLSVSGHKIFAPKGVGALVMRKRGYQRIPLKPLIFGGGQERGLRPGTLPVALIVSLGEAAELALRDASTRMARCKSIREVALTALSGLNFKVTGDPSRTMPHVLNASFAGLDSEALIVALKDLLAFSNGSACTSASYTPSHVLTAMGMTEVEANGCVRLSWCHLTPDIDWGAVAERIRGLY